MPYQPINRDFALKIFLKGFCLLVDESLQLSEDADLDGLVIIPVMGLASGKVEHLLRPEFPGSYFFLAWQAAFEV